MTNLIAQINYELNQLGLLPNPNRITSLEMTSEGLAVGTSGGVDIDTVDASALLDYLKSDVLTENGFYDICDWVNNH
jgi:hypothetical protein